MTPDELASARLALEICVTACHEVAAEIEECAGRLATLQGEAPFALRRPLIDSAAELYRIADRLRE